MVKDIKICMGSSCFARGNDKNLEFIEKYIKEHQLEAEIEVYGSRCDNICDKGPNIIIDGNVYNNVTIDMIIKLFNE